MNLDMLKEYEVLKNEELPDLNSEGMLLRHKKKVVHGSCFYQMMMTIRFFISAFVQHLITVPGLPISWSILFYADRANFR